MKNVSKWTKRVVGLLSFLLPSIGVQSCGDDVVVPPDSATNAAINKLLKSGKVTAKFAASQKEGTVCQACGAAEQTSGE